MASVNKVIIVGNLGRDPETRYLPSGEAVTNISIATTDTWKDKATGENEETTSGPGARRPGRPARGAPRRWAREGRRAGQEARRKVRRHGRRYSVLSRMFR